MGSESMYECLSKEFIMSTVEWSYTGFTENLMNEIWGWDVLNTVIKLLFAYLTSQKQNPLPI